MGMSIFYAKFLGIYMLLVGLIWLLRRKPFELAVRDLLSSDGLMVLTGAINLLFGLAIVISHPVWEFNWRGLITLLGLIAIFQGVIRLAFLDEVKKFALKNLEKMAWPSILILVLLGGFLTYHGFTVQDKQDFWWFLK